MKISEVMTKNPKFIEVPGTRDELFELIQETNQTSFPVLKKGTSKLVGIVTETDIVQKPSETQLALLMTKNPVAVSPDTDIAEVIKIFTKNKFRQVPVIKDEKLIGIVTIGDIITKVISVSSSDQTIEKFMKQKVTGLWEQTPLPACQKIMEYAGVEAALAFDAKGEMVGIVTMVDFVKFFDAISSEKRDEVSSGEGKEGSWDAVSTIIVQTKNLILPEIPLKEIMTKEVITTFSKASISDVAKKMHQKELYQMPVVDAKGKVIGMIRDIDLLQAYSS
ncbi:MAG: CBS domain-containing protein [Asgard group archaeon]|nr:CBS domain-containing protein [Asgard group archaeon]